MLRPTRSNSQTGNTQHPSLQGVKEISEQMSLSERIHQRIIRRLNDRVRDLAVQVTGDRIVLRGQCATYYSKQLAQHAALGAIEDESLENAIEVMVANSSPV